MNKKKLLKIQDNLKIKFKSIDLLERSLTHKSYDSINNYEKLEFLGDRVLGLTISKRLIELYPDDKEGILDKKLASLVNKNKCFDVGKKLMLDEFILVGNSNKYSTKIESKIVSDCCEAIIGAVYLDKGFELTEKFILNIWKDLIKESNKMHIDAKTKLQEFSLKKYKTLPIYKLISNTGPRHKPNFKVAVRVKDSKFISATGNSKKNAEQEAAKEFLKFLNL
tara:strand:+ start:799 stop:1467 length:669 start_codon:yes stop_codon:yes gene_type:complete